jgi:hypothetical protein
MSISSYLKRNRKLISWLLAIIAAEVGLLIFWGAIAYKNERLDADDQLKEFMDLMNQKDREEQEKWKDLQTRIIEFDLFHPQWHKSASRVSDTSLPGVG